MMSSISSSWSNFHHSIQNLKQALINNGYTNRLFDSVLSKYLNTVSQTKSHEQTVSHHVYYRNQFSNAYKTDERVLKHIIRSNTEYKNPQEKLKLIIYYKNPTTTSLIMKNKIGMHELPECDSCKSKVFLGCQSWIGIVTIGWELSV